MKLPLDCVATLLRACAATGDEELTCDELLDFLAGHLEGASIASTGDRRQGLAQQHLRLCASCREEGEALAAVLAAEPQPPRSL